MLPLDVVPPPNPDKVFLNECIEIFVVDEAGNRLENVEFANPIEIRYPLPADAPAGTARAIQYYDPGADSWIQVPTVVREDDTVRGFVRHVTLFALS
jgi:hypothetical protein